MKEPNHPHPHDTTIAISGVLSKATFSLLLFSLGYLLGYALGFLSTSPQTPPHLLLQLPSQPLIKSTSPHPSPPPPDLLRFRTHCAAAVPDHLILPTLLANLYNNTSPYNNFPDPSTAPHLLPPPRRPRGWGSTNSVFSDLIASVRPRTIIELGTFLGASALHMAAITRNLSLPDTLILCIDDFRGWPGFHRRFHRDIPTSHNGDSLLLHQFMLGASAAGESHRLLPVPFSTSSALQALCEWGVYGDLVEVDAGHDFHSAWADINRAWAVVRPGGVLFGHDYHTAADDRGVRRAVTLFAKVRGLTVKPHGEHWVLSPKPNSAF